MNVQVPFPAYVASIQQAGVNVFDDGLYVEAKSAQVSLRIEIHAAGETVEGDVRVSQVKEAPNAVVVLVPDSSRRGRSLNVQAGSRSDLQLDLIQ